MEQNRSSTVERFSNRVANYVKYRPGYPPGVIELLRDELGLTPDSVVADIGAGTGISSRMFLENGNTVYGVEPNAAMRAAAVEYLAGFPKFKPVNGTAENTGLPDASVDLVAAAQAFHWFDREQSAREFRRILKPGGRVVLIWNERELDTTPFLADYERLLLKYGTDYEKVRHENISEQILNNSESFDFSQRTFENAQVLDLEGLKGRMLSASYVPAEDDPRFRPMIGELAALFAEHEEQGKIKVLYRTHVFYTEV